MYRIQLKTKQDFTSVALIVDGLGRLRLIQFCFQVTEATVATQNLNSLLLYTGSSDAEILQTRESRVLHVCCVKLENESTLKDFLIDYPEKAPWYKAEGGIHTSFQAMSDTWQSYPIHFVWGCPGLKRIHCKQLGSQAGK